MSTTERLQLYLRRMEEELDRTMEFWMKHSPDRENGGFFTCLGRDGKLYDTDKYGWMAGRQVWTYSKLYNETDKFHTSDILQDAISGGEFLMKYVKRSEDCRCYFQVTADGKPVKLQRKLFSECFYAMAMAELGKATKDKKYTGEALAMLSKLLYWARVDDTDLGCSKLEGQTPVNAMAVPMMMMCVIDDVCGGDQALRAKYAEHEDWALLQTLQHIQRDGTVILENVSLEGKEIQGSQGRIVNPGHAIEAGWFLLQHALRKQDNTLAALAIEKFILGPFELGWDDRYGGVFYFLDADGWSPVPLEWNMKLFWVHNEALIAFIMAYKHTKEQKLLDKFDQVFQYTFSKFPDTENGEWYGWLDRFGNVTHTFKAGPYKGCFHLPRCLHMCINMLKSLLEEMGN